VLEAAELTFTSTTSTFSTNLATPVSLPSGEVDDVRIEFATTIIPGLNSGQSHNDLTVSLSGSLIDSNDAPHEVALDVTDLFRVDAASSGGGGNNDPSPEPTATPDQPDEPIAITIDASDATLVVGQSASLTGTLSGAPDCIAGAEISIDETPYGETVRTSRAVSGQDGSWSLPISPRHNSTYRASVAPRPGCASALSDEQKVSVAATISLDSTRRRLPAGGCAVLTGIVTPAPDKDRVRLRIWRRNRPYSSDTVALHEGRFRARHCFGRPGRWTLRAVWAGGPANEGATSRLLTLRTY
jgi:hypothetical protein